MTSRIVADELLHSLIFLGGRWPPPAPEFRFERDFDSQRPWPDLAFDPAIADARYPTDARADVLRVLDDVAALLSARAPRVLSFVNTHLDHALIRRSDAIAGAFSASNRAHVGVCVLTNMHVPVDRTLVCAEAILHESIHQYLYKTELETGNFCDLGEARTYRSPWSGARIPLHSLIHATLVWFGLLTLWCQLGRGSVDAAEAQVLGERASRIEFGFAFIGQLLQAPGFPMQSVDPRVVGLIDRIAGSSAERGAGQDNGRTFIEAVALRDRGGWVEPLTARLQRIPSAGGEQQADAAARFAQPVVDSGSRSVEQ